MKPDFLSFDEVMHECNQDNPAHFVRRVQKVGLQVKRGQDVPTDLAEQIVFRLLGRKIDWYKYRRRERDRATSGPLVRSRDTGLSALAMSLWQRLPESVSRVRTPRRVLALACTGGFLRGEYDEPFILAFDDGVTILIGDRGSGKSTVLNLLSLLANPIQSSTGVLLAKVMDLLRDKREDLVEKTRQVRNVLDHYSIRQYACFYCHQGDVICYVADLESAQFALLKLDGVRFDFVHEQYQHLPDMQVLQQGEVFRIADESSPFYLNSLLDVLFPELGRRRQELISAANKLPEQLRHQRPNRLTPRWVRELEDFVHDREAELSALEEVVDRRRLDVDTRGVLRKHIDEFRRLRGIGESTAGKLPKTMLEALDQGDHAHWYLYLWPILGISAGRVEELGASFPGLGEKDSTDSARGRAISSAKSEGQLEDVDAGRLWGSLQVVVEGLRVRLAQLIAIGRAYKERFPWEEKLQGLSRAYSELLRAHIDLVRLQDACCEEISRVLKQDQTMVRVSTRDSGDMIETETSEQQDVQGIGAADGLSQATSATNDLEHVVNALELYGKTTSRVLRRCQQLVGPTGDLQQDFFFPPIDVELRQGSEYRPFNHLSFGQKSGIILKMVLGTTQKHIVVIDQPEDNLDTSAIVYMVAPTLRRLGQDRQVIIATHSSNLVMGLPASRVVVLQSSGDYGRVLVRGSLLTGPITRAVLDILEGGRDAFEAKIKTYESFVQQLTGFIRDMDISLIESTFRRRTIDGLRNLLQPVVSDRDMLRFFTHELRQPSPLGERIQELREAVGTGVAGEDRVRLAAELDRLLRALDEHMARLQSNIEEMRMLDTQPRKAQVALGPLLREITEDYQRRFGKGSRTIAITVDERLDGEAAFADPNHLRLVFSNLIRNSLRATEHRAAEVVDEGGQAFIEVVAMQLESNEGNRVSLLLRDNGRGIPSEIRSKLYQERCSDQVGEHRGLGGVVIRKMLDLNGGSIAIVESGSGRGTLQRVTLPARAES